MNDTKIRKKNENGIRSYYVKKGIKTNFHAGFVDMNPKYNEARQERARKVANIWQDKLANKLLQKHEEVGRVNFN